MSAYDSYFPLLLHLNEALAYPVIEGSDIGVRLRQRPDDDPLVASGMA